MRVFKDIYYNQTEDEMNTLDVFCPDGEAKCAFLYIHGGGIEQGSKADGERLGQYLCDRGVAVININYRKYPNAKYPDFICDAADAVAWAKKNIKDTCGTDKLFVGGTSAGGYISMMLCFDKRYLAAVGLDNSAIEGYLHDAGQPTAHFNVLRYSGIDSRRVIVDETAPLYHIGTEKEYPPMRFLVSDDDMQNRYEQTMLVLSTMKHFGYENYDHIVLHGKHCQSFGSYDEQGNNILATLIYDFLKDKI